MQLEPPERERGLRSLRQLLALGALEVCVEREAAFVDSAHEHEAGIGMAGGIDGTQHHGVRLIGPGGHGVLVPTQPLLHGIGQDVGDVETGGFVLRAQIGYPHRTSLSH